MATQRFFIFNPKIGEDEPIWLKPPTSLDNCSKPICLEVLFWQKCCYCICVFWFGPDEPRNICSTKKWCLFEILSNYFQYFWEDFGFPKPAVIDGTFLCRYYRTNLNQQKLYKTILKGYALPKTDGWNLNIPSWKRQIIFHSPPIFGFQPFVFGRCFFIS